MFLSSLIVTMEAILLGDHSKKKKITPPTPKSFPNFIEV